MNFFEKARYICGQIPSGKVASYGQIAELAGNSRMARQVGWALNKSSEQEFVPAHRVVNREGVLSGADAFLLEGEQESRLRSEGVLVENRKVNIIKFGWSPTREERQMIEDKVREIDGEKE